jgi:uncharacterized membrane protein
MDIAPVSRDRSMRVMIAAAWLVLNAGLSLPLLLLGALSDPSELAGAIVANPITVAINLAFIAFMLLSGLALYRRSILGGYGGILVYGLALVTGLFISPLTLTGVVVAGLGVFAILSAWDELEAPKSEFSETIEIAASPARVWEVMRDVSRWPEWTASITSVTPEGDEPLDVGSRVGIRQPGLPPATWEVTELEAGKGFTWVSRTPGVEATARHLIEPAQEGSRVRLSVLYGGVLGPLVASLFRGKTEQYILLEAYGLKRRSEPR